MAEDNPTNPDGTTEGSKEKKKNPTPTLAAEIAKHVVAALRPQPKASKLKGKRSSTAHPSGVIVIIQVGGGGLTGGECKADIVSWHDKPDL